MKAHHSEKSAVLEVDIDMISVLEMKVLLHNYIGYVDGDKRKLRLFLNIKEKRA